MSATTLTAFAADPAPDGEADALPDGIRVVRGILLGGIVSCGLWVGIVAAVMAII